MRFIILFDFFQYLYYVQVIPNKNYLPMAMVYQVPLDGVTFLLSTKIASFYVSHIWYEGVTLASHGRGKSQNTRYANDVIEFVYFHIDQ